MEYKYKHHHDIKSLSLIIKDVNDQKRMLWEKIHLFNTLSYEKGSQKTDYLIRERIKGIQDDLSQFEGAIGLFEYGKNGDLKAYEDLLIFFVRNFIDKFEISDKLQLLKAAIAEIETKNEIYGLKYAGRDIIGKKNLLISELQKNLRNLETQLHHSIVPTLRKFLNDINHILFFEKATTCVNNIRLKGHFSRNAFNVEYLKNCITSFILFNHKINAHDCSDISLKEFILNTLHDAKLEKMRTSNGANDKNVLDKIINKIFHEIDDQLQQMEETLCAKEEVKEAAGFGEKMKILSRCNELI